VTSDRATAHRAAADEELVRVIPRAALIAGRGWRGIRPADLDTVIALVEREGSLRPRASMEHDPDFKQVIPYLVLRDGRDYFLMRRTRAGVDRRLHDRWSIGIGGHLNPIDATVRAGLLREWAEELRADFIPDFRFVGLLNDDLTDVGRVHVGLVFEAQSGGRAVAIRETDKLEGAFASAATVASVAGQLESWSRLVFDHLEARRAS
jgi:predicted NUDIX family phosphoesterase